MCLAGFGMPAQLSHAPSASFRTAFADCLGLVLRQMTVLVVLPTWFFYSVESNKKLSLLTMLSLPTVVTPLQEL